jgi:hypothetical protein
MLKLQLRSAEREAADAEAALSAIDLDAAVEQLRNQLEPKLAARREAMDLELENEQTKAAAVTAKARRAADVMVTQATMEMRRAQPEPEPMIAVVPEAEPVVDVVPEAEPVVDVVPEPEPVVDVVPEPEPVVDVVPEPEPVVDVVPEPEPVIDVVPEPEPVIDVAPEPELVVDVVPEALVELVPDEVPAATAPVDEPAVVMPPVERNRNDALPSPYGVGAAPSSLATEGSVFILDAQGLAHVLARVIVGILDEREATRPPVPQPQSQQWVYPPMMMMPQQQVAPVPEKKPGWKSAMHLDVVLLGISTVVVLVVLAAWLG